MRPPQRAYRPTSTARKREVIEAQGFKATVFHGERIIAILSARNVTAVSTQESAERLIGMSIEPGARWMWAETVNGKPFKAPTE